MTEREIIAKEWRDENGILHRREVGQELVRCKDCIHWQLLTSPFGLCVWNEDNKRQMEETGFCSCGVMR